MLGTSIIIFPNKGYTKLIMIPNKELASIIGLNTYRNITTDFIPAGYFCINERNGLCIKIIYGKPV